MEKEAPARIIFWKKTNDGLSCRPVSIRLGIKVKPDVPEDAGISRNIDLFNIIFDSLRDDYKDECPRPISVTAVNIYFEQDIYISFEKSEALQELFSHYFYKPITPYSCEHIKQELLCFIKGCFREGKADIEKPDYPSFRIRKDYAFDDR